MTVCILFFHHLARLKGRAVSAIHARSSMAPITRCVFKRKNVARLPIVDILCVIKSILDVLFLKLISAIFSSPKGIQLHFVCDGFLGVLKKLESIPGLVILRDIFVPPVVWNSLPEYRRCHRAGPDLFGNLTWTHSLFCCKVLLHLLPPGLYHLDSTICARTFKIQNWRWNDTKI